MIPTYLSKIQFNFFNLKEKKERTKNLFKYSNISNKKRPQRQALLDFI